MSPVFREEQSKNVSKEVKRDSTDPWYSHCDLLCLRDHQFLHPSFKPLETSGEMSSVSSTQLRQINDLALNNTKNNDRNSPI